MATLVSRITGLSAADQAEWVARSAQPHQIQWRLDCVRWAAGGAGDQLLVEDVPIIGGSLVLDSSDQVRARLSVEVGGGEALAPTSSDSPLTPFGQRLLLYARIDRVASGWFPWLQMGDFWIRSNTFERPSQILTLEATDLSGAVEEYAFLNKRGFKDQKVGPVITDLVTEALPDAAVEQVNQGDAAERRKAVLGPQAAESGTGRWTHIQLLSDSKNLDVFFDARGRLVFRPQLGSGDEPGGWGGEGPDIGTVANPVGIIADGPGGTMVGLTATITRDSGVNLVRYNLHATKPKAKRKNKDGSVSISAQDDADGSPVKWGDRFGRLPLIYDRNEPDLTADVRQDYTKRAKAVLQRRLGLVRYLDMDALPMLWLEPDDRVLVEWRTADGTTRSEAHFLQRCEFNLAAGGGGPMRLRTRQLSVVELG